ELGIRIAVAVVEPRKDRSSMTTTNESTGRLTSIGVTELNHVVGGETWVTAGGQVIVDGHLVGEKRNGLVYWMGSPGGEASDSDHVFTPFRSQQSGGQR